MAETSVVPVKRGDGKLRRAEPIGFLDEFEAEMDRFWRRPWSFWPGAWLRPFRGLAREPLTFAPRMDVYEKDNAIVVKAELPGLKKEVCKTGENGRSLRRESYTQNGRRRTAKTVENVQRFRLMAYSRFRQPNSQNGQSVHAG